MSEESAAPQTVLVPSSNSHQALLTLGGLGLLIGALLPWVSVTAPLVGTLTINGYEGDGLISGGIGLAVLVFALLRKGEVGKRYSVISTVLALLAAFVIFPKFGALGSVAGGIEFGSASLGAGLYLSAVGAILAFFGGIKTVE